MKIFLVGMPGSGKSSVGKLLAESLRIPFIDLDTIIEKEAGRAIREIFSTQGEARFRELERDALLKVISEKDRFIVATGGGAPCFFDNLEHMKKNGKVVFLDLPMSTIAQRLQNEGLAVRPLLKDFFTLEKLEAHLMATFDKRSKYYRQADIRIDANSPVAQIVKKIEKSIL